MINDEEREIVIYASFYPIYGILHSVTSGAPLVTVECFTQPISGCLRSYDLSNWDIAKLSLADAVFIGGRGLESFEDMLSGADFAVVEVMQTLELFGADEEVPDGDDEASHFVGANPWAWLSVDLAKRMCETTAAAMVQLDPQYEDLYYENLGGVCAKLDALKDDMTAAMPEGERGVAVMHEGIEYLANELGLPIVTTIERESASDMDAKSLAQAIEQIKSSGAEAALIEKQAPEKLLKSLRDGGINVVLIDTFAYRSSGDYFETMKQNALSIAEALRGGNDGY